MLTLLSLLNGSFLRLVKKLFTITSMQAANKKLPVTAHTGFSMRLFFSACFLLLTVWILPLTPAYAADGMASADHSLMLWPLIMAVLSLLLLGGFTLLIGAQFEGDQANRVLMNITAGSSCAVLLFMLFGHNLMFGENPTGLFGSISSFSLSGDASLVFYSILAALVVLVAGSATVTLPLHFYIGVSILITPLFAVVGSWMWNFNNELSQGWLQARGFIDIGGSTVIHSFAGWVALAAILALGSSQTDAEDSSQSKNVHLSGIALFLIWSGWLGLALGTNLFAAQTMPIAETEQALLNTVLAGVSGIIAAILANYMVNQKLQLTTLVLGCVAGLVSISAGVSIMPVEFAIFSGMVGGAIAVFSMLVLQDMKIHDVAGAVSAHALPGVWGTLAAGVFYSGDFFNPDRVLVQMLGVVSVFLSVFILSWLLYRLMAKVFGVTLHTNGSINE